VPVKATLASNRSSKELIFLLWSGDCTYFQL